MEELKRNAEYDFAYNSCIYSGISRQIEFETKYGTEDKSSNISLTDTTMKLSFLGRI